MNCAFEMSSFSLFSPRSNKTNFYRKINAFYKISQSPNHSFSVVYVILAFYNSKWPQRRKQTHLQFKHNLHEIFSVKNCLSKNLCTVFKRFFFHFIIKCPKKNLIPKNHLDNLRTIYQSFHWSLRLINWLVTKPGINLISIMPEIWHFLIMQTCNFREPSKIISACGSDESR